MKSNKGITIVTLVITLIIAVILMGVTIYGAFNWTKKAGDNKIYSTLSFVYRRIVDLEGIKEECNDGHIVLKNGINTDIFTNIPSISSGDFPSGVVLPSNYDIYEIKENGLKKLGISESLVPRGMRIFYFKSRQVNIKDKLITNKGIMKKDNSGNTVVLIDYSDILKYFENSEKTVLY